MYRTYLLVKHPRNMCVGAFSILFCRNLYQMMRFWVVNILYAEYFASAHHGSTNVWNNVQFVSVSKVVCARENFDGKRLEAEAIK